MENISRWCLRLIQACIVSYMCLALNQPAFAQSSPVQFEADKVETNQEKGILTATGNVVLVQDGSELRADKVEYDRKAARAIASGHVILRTPDGATHMSDYLDLSDDFKRVFAEPMISDMADGSRFTSSTAQGDIDTKLEMTSTSFTPCDCDHDNGETPIWDLRATKTTHDKTTSTIIHENVRLHIFGLPVFYLPILAHPDWTVTRRTGFLAPSMRYSSTEGSTISAPYYKTLGPSADVTVTPYIFQHRGQAIHTTYREKTDYSELTADIYTADVATFKKDREAVGAIDLYHRTKVGDNWNVNTHVIRTSQDTFLRRYKFKTSYNLKSQVTADRIKQDRYFLVEASDFQGLREDDTSDKEPTVLPHIYYEAYQDGFRDNQLIRTEISAIQVANDEGNDLMRWSSDISVQEEYKLFNGSLDAEFGVMSSIYDIKKKTVATQHDGEIGQANPYASLDWRAPVAAIADFGVVMLEPRAKFTIIGGADRTDEVPNRDASDFRLDEANLFMTHRHQGKDFVLPGTRADIGLTALADDTIFGEINSFAGISRRIKGDTTTGLTTGNNRNYSDYVASISLKPSDDLSISWSGRADSHDFELNESRTNVAWKYKGTDISVEHAQLSKAHFKSSTSDREALSAVIKQRLPDGWVGTASQNWDLSSGQTKRDKTRFTLAWTGGFQDCLTLSLDYQRSSSGDRDIKRTDEVFLVFNFKYLGAISQSDLQNK